MSAIALALALGSRVAAQGQVHSASVRPAPSATAAALVLDQVTVIDVEHGRRLRDQRVVVVGRRIQALGSRRTVAPPPGARLVNAQGKYLIPGLWDMHVHLAGLPESQLPSSWSSLDHKVKAASYQLLANGVTGIRDAGSAVPLDTFRVWKRELAAGQRVGPRLVVSGKMIVDSSAYGDSCTPGFFASYPWTTCLTQGTAAQSLVDSLKAAGADMLKLYRLSTTHYFALAAAARQAGLPFGGHIDPSDFSAARPLDGLIFSDSGTTFLDHAAYKRVCGSRGEPPDHSEPDTVLSLSQCVAAAARLRRNNTWVAAFWPGWAGSRGATLWDAGTMQAFLERAVRNAGPATMAAARDSTWRPLSAAERKQLPAGDDFAQLFRATYSDSGLHGDACRRAMLAYAADLPAVPGSDWPAVTMGPLGAMVHASLLYPVLCGVPPLWALQTATLNPARALGATDSLGTVAVGKLADLVLLEGDPLEDIWNVSKIAAVVANGRYFDRAALDRLLVAAAAEWGQAQVAPPPNGAQP